jgi:predicted helicase
MKYTKRGDTSSITFNTDIVIKDIPERAQQYKVNVRTSMERIMEQYKLEVKKNSQIVFDPNRYSPND